MLAPRTFRRVSSNSSTSSLMDQQPCNSLIFKGLPTWADNNYLLTFMNQTHIAKGRDGQLLISLFPFKAGQQYRNGKITYNSIETAWSYLDRWNKECPPGSNNKLTVSYWKEEAKYATRVKEPEKPSNSILIQGLPENIAVGYICFFVGGNIARGKSNQPLVQVFPAKNGFSSARVILTSIAEASQFIEENNNKPLAGNQNRLTIKYYAERTCNSPKYDADMTRKVREATAAESKSVLIKGLFENCNDDYLISLIGHQKIAMGNKGRRLVIMFSSYSSAKVTFNTVADAQEFIANYHQKTLPLHDKKKLTVQFYLEREEQRELSKPIVTGERQSDKAKTIVRNVVYIQGINKKYNKDELIELVERRTGKKISKAKIYRYPDGKSEGRGTITYRDAADAQLCIQVLNGRRLDDTDVLLKLGLFESTRIKRLDGAIGNDHLFGRNTKGYAYECLGCLETWDERDMVGCVPLERQADPEIHFLCQSCVRRYCESNKLDGRLGDHGTGFPCGQENCKRIMLWAPVNRVLINRETAARLDKRMTDEALRDIEGIEFCKEDCGFGAFLPDPQRMQFFSCKNPGCMAQFCRICQVSFMQHAGKNCDQVDPRRQQARETQRLKDEINEKLSLSQMLICPKCSLRVGKDGGCNFMTCRCGCTMCYVCKQANINQSHFTNGGCNQGEITADIDRRNYDRAMSAIDADATMRGLLTNV